MPIPPYVVELRRAIGTDLLWLPAVTAVVRRGEEMLMVERADTGAWTPVTGILDPGEEPAVGALREIMEETGVTARVDRVAAVTAGIDVTYPNGDRATYLDVCLACTWVSGEPYAADDESTDARWWPVADLPPMPEAMRARVDAALSSETAARFRG